MTSTIVLLSWCLAGFGLLMMIETAFHRLRCNSPEQVLESGGNLSALFLKHLVVIIVLGPAVSLGIMDYQGAENSIMILPESRLPGMTIWFVLTAAAVLTGIASARQYRLSRPVLRLEASGREIFGVAVVRLVSLVAYELYFRGALLGVFMAVSGVAAAISVNVLLYALAHSLRGWKQGLGSIPFGVLLCLLTIRLQSVWPAISIHLALALSNEIRMMILFKSPFKRVTNENLHNRGNRLYRA